MYVAIINVPGYLPTDNDPPIFDTAHEAWQYLADERRRDEENVETDVAVDDGELLHLTYSETVDYLDNKAAAALHVNRHDWDGTGSVSGPTPGYEGDHDLGLDYSVDVAETDAPNN